MCESVVISSRTYETPDIKHLMATHSLHHFQPPKMYDTELQFLKQV